MKKNKKEIKLEQKRILDCEWVFQFDEDEPQIFAWTDKNIKSDEDPSVTFTITNIESAFISFKHNESKKTFKIFAREITKAGKKMREESNKLISEAQTDLKNLDENIQENES